MNKKLFSILLVTTFSVCLSAQEWDGTSIQAPQQIDNVYHISTGAELAWVAQESKTNDFAGSTFVMDSDIDLGEAHNWTPIAGGDIEFQGVFDGQCHTIKRLFITYVPRNTDIGLFGAVGTNGIVKNIAVESGKIFISEMTNVGTIAGRNEGTITHTFGMIQILADASNNIGGIAGINNGSLQYSYQAGYISDAGNNSGGLAGVNNGSVSKSYCSGYTMSSGSNCGAVVGVNNGTFTDTYFDQQMCMQKASTKDEDGITPIIQTTNMQNIFTDDAEWYTPNFEDHKTYPQLSCFATTSPDASNVSSLMVFLPTNDPPVQRAENITKNFTLSTIYEGSKWSSPDTELIRILTTTGAEYTSAVVTRPCSNRVITITAYVNNSSRGYLLQVKGYNTFNPGIIGGEKRACHGDGIRFSDRNNGGEITGAVGGRDDDKKKFPYYYRIEQYQLLDNDLDGVYEDTVFFKSYTMDSEAYKEWRCDTEHDGHWVYRLYAHDSQCQLDYVRAIGEFYLTVFSGFDAGKVEDVTDTIYGDYPKAVFIGSDIDAEGGEGPYLYEWYLTKMEINYLTGDTAILADSARYLTAKDGATATLDTVLETTGEYFFYRAARDLYCHRDSYTSSEGARHFVVFDYLTPGIIAGDTLNVCLDDNFYVNINETEAPTGGNGIYTYRWLINDEVIPDADSSALLTGDIPFEAGQTYKIVRQVKDNTGLMDWTTSEQAYIVHINNTFSAGSIIDDSTVVCLKKDTVRFPIRAYESMPAKGDGEINYRWLVYNTADNKRLLTLNQNTPELSGDSITLDISLPAKISVVRQCQNPICSDQWITSENQKIIVIGRNESREENIYVCQEDLPYTGTYTFGSGETATYTFKDEYGSAHVLGYSETGCNEEVWLNCQIVEMPRIRVFMDKYICRYYSDRLYIHFDIDNTLFTRYQYNITFNAAAYEAGFTDISEEINDTNIIRFNDSIHYDIDGFIHIPIGAVPIGNYQLYIQFSEIGADISCQNPVDTLDFSVFLGGYVHQKWNDVLYIDNNDKNGRPYAEDDMQFTSYQWYKDGEPIEGATGQVYVEQGGLNGYYYAVLTDTEGNQYQTCIYNVRPTALNDAENQFYIYPTVLAPNQEINVSGTGTGTISIINIDGKTYSSQPADCTITAPAQSGIYVVLFTTTDGKNYYNKIIVK